MDPIQTPNSPKTEAAAALIRGALGMVPIAGSFMAELGNLYLNPLEKRRKEWMDRVCEALEEIKLKLGVLPEELQENEEFISFLYQATSIALRNHRREKLRALKQAVISAAGPGDMDEESAFQFLRYVDELGVLHLKVLSCINTNEEKFAGLEKLEDVLIQAEGLIVEIIDRTQFRAIMRDLESRTLIRMVDIDDLPEFASGKSMIFACGGNQRPLQVSTFGKKFLDFIRANDVNDSL